jgi:ribosomal protein S18 acetylase RimI-like enzyme
MIRRALPADLPALKSVIEATGLFPADLLDEMTAPAFRDPASTDRWWVIGDDPEVLGLAYAAPERMTDGTWNLLLIAIAPDRQGQHLGTALLAAIEADLAVSGVRLLLIETSDLPEFAATRAFYARRGYEKEATLRDFYAAGDDKVVFRKPL